MITGLLFPFAFGIAFFVALVMATVYGPCAHDIDHVILRARKLDPSDLEMLLDAGAEWKLRQSLTILAFRAAQEDRIRLAREYLQRVGHNAGLIQFWIMPENQPLVEGKPREKYTERDSLVAEAFELAMELRLYSIGATVRIGAWLMLKMYRWPQMLIPRVPDLRVQCGVDVIKKYRRLTELAVILSARYGKNYQDQLVEVLQSRSV